MVALGASAFVGFGGSEDDDLVLADRPDNENEEAAPEIDDVMAFLDRDDTSTADAVPDTDGKNISSSDDDGPIPQVQIEGHEESGATLLPDAVDTAGDLPSEAAPSPDAERIAVGTPENDVMQGTDARDVVNGYDGADTLSGGPNTDQLWGGSGADALSGGAGDDTLHGGGGDDDLRGDEGDDHLFGHEGADLLEGGDGVDMLVGGAGDDTLTGGHGADVLHGGLGDDILDGGAGSDTLFGGWGDDTISGIENDQDGGDRDLTDIADFLNGGGGDDVITAGPGDVVTAGEGADTVILDLWTSAAHQAEILDFAPDEDTLMVVYDDTAGITPDVDLAADPDNDSILQIMLNGVAIATVNNAAGLNAGHITLVGSSALGADMHA